MTSTFTIFMLIALATGAAASGDKIVGGVSDVDSAKIPEITELLKNNLHRLEGEALVKLIEVQRVTQQVVTGILYSITGVFEDKDKEQFVCEITIWERAWLDEPEQVIVQMKSKSALTAAGNSGSGSSTGAAAKEF